MKRFFKIILITVGLLFVGGSIYLYSFFKENEAPILYGELDYNVEFKEEINLDVYQPTQKVYERSPVVIHFHGGAWVSGSKLSANNARFNGAINTLRDKGYAVVAPDYTLAESDHTPFPDCLIDALDAVAWVEEHAETHNFDLNNVGLMGESAGAHIAMMTAYDKSPAYSPTHQSSLTFDYVVNSYGPTELYQLYKSQIPLIDSIEHMTENLPESIQKRFDIAQTLFGFDPAVDTVKAFNYTLPYSPYQQLDETAPPTLIIHGDADQVVPISQSYLLQTRLDSLKIPNEFHVLPGVDHAFRGATEEQKQMIQDWIAEYVVRQYNDPS